MLALLRTKRIQSLNSPFLTRWHQSRVHNYSTRTILTLNPAKLQSTGQEVHDISFVKALSFRFWTIGGASQTKFRYRATMVDGRFQDIGFPAQSRGVFYYHVDPHLPSISGGIRFRLCDSLATFDKGQDLQTSARKPWEVPLLRIAHDSRYKAIARLLIEDGMVEMNLVRELRKLDLPSRSGGLYLYHLSQPLVIDLEIAALKIHLVTTKTYSPTLFLSPFSSSHQGSPYSGLVKGRLELSTLPEHKQIGPTLVLRILEFLSPIQRAFPNESGPYIEQVTNSLALKRTQTGILKPWTYPINRRVDGAKWKTFLAESLSDRNLA